MRTKLTSEEKAERARQRHSESAKDFHRANPRCWMCEFLGRQQTSPTELHHMAGRGRRHDVRQNYAALCDRCHRALQSVVDAEVVCLVLKLRHDSAHYNPALICDLRGWAPTWINTLDVRRCERIMGIMREVA